MSSLNAFGTNKKLLPTLTWFLATRSLLYNEVDDVTTILWSVAVSEEPRCHFNQSSCSKSNNKVYIDYYIQKLPLSCCFALIYMLLHSISCFVIQTKNIFINKTYTGGQCLNNRLSNHHLDTLPSVGIRLTLIKMGIAATSL